LHHRAAQAQMITGFYPSLDERWGSGHRLQLREHRVELRKIGHEGIFSADRLSDPIGSDLAVVDASGNPIAVTPRLTEVCLHEPERLIAHIETGKNPSEFILALVAGPMP
jgi:hypothetical protein